MLKTQTTQSAQIYAQCDMGEPETMSAASGNVVALCRRCPDKTQPNDDSAGVVETESSAVVMIVADGVGGAPLGHKASAIAVQTIIESVQSATDSTDLRFAILDGMEQANRAILDFGVGAATTITVVEIQGSTARTYQVGDSMALIIGQRGAVKWQTMVQSPVGHATEAGIIDEVEALYHEDRHYVSNLAGTAEMYIQVGPAIELASRDTVIIGSDGLFDNLLMDEVIEMGRSGKLIDRIDDLARVANSRMIEADGDEGFGKPDDLTVLLYTA